MRPSLPVVLEAHGTARSGCTLEIAPSDAFYGERSGCIRDPFGHRWNIGHHIEDVSTDEMQRRYVQMFEMK